MMFVGPQRIRYLIEDNKDKFLKEYEAYLQKICEGNEEIKRRMRYNPRVISTVLANFIRKHQGELGVHALESDEIDLSESLTPLIIEYLKQKESLTTTTTGG